MSHYNTDVASTINLADLHHGLVLVEWGVQLGAGWRPSSPPGGGVCQW